MAGRLGRRLGPTKQDRRRATPSLDTPTRPLCSLRRLRLVVAIVVVVAAVVPTKSGTERAGQGRWGSLSIALLQLLPARPTTAAAVATHFDPIRRIRQNCAAAVFAIARVPSAYVCVPIYRTARARVKHERDTGERGEMRLGEPSGGGKRVLLRGKGLEKRRIRMGWDHA